MRATYNKTFWYVPPAIPHQCLVCFGVMNPWFAGHGATLLPLLKDSSVLHRPVETAAMSRHFPISAYSRFVRDSLPHRS